MIASTDRDGRVTVTGTVREWLLFLERLDAGRLEQADEFANAREILITASAVPLSGGRKREVDEIPAHLKTGPSKS